MFKRLANSWQLIKSSAAVLRSDNRVILTYLPELPPADTSVVDDHVAVDEEVAA